MTNETGRIEAFSDGVFSIAATLLVLELKRPAAGMPFWLGILHQWPGYVSFLMSFLYIGIMWINHHRLFTHIHGTDDVLMVANLLVLLGVVWIPYPTLLMAEALAGGSIHEAAIFYNGSYVVLALLFNLLLLASVRRGLVDRSYVGVQDIAKRFALGPMAYGVTFAITWWSVPVSLALNAGLALFYLLSPDKRARVSRRS